MQGRSFHHTSPNVQFCSFCRDADEAIPSNEKHEGKEKSTGNRRGGRYHPYKDKHGGEKKPAHRNRVFISNIPYDMKWQAIKDLMREKGNVIGDRGDVSYYAFLPSSLKLLYFSLCCY